MLLPIAVSTPPDRAAPEQFGTAFDLSTEPLDVGEKTLAGLTANNGLILAQTERSKDFGETRRISADGWAPGEIPGAAAALDLSPRAVQDR